MKPTDKDRLLLTIHLPIDISLQVKIIKLLTNYYEGIDLPFLGEGERLCIYIPKDTDEP